MMPTITAIRKVKDEDTLADAIAIWISKDPVWKTYAGEASAPEHHQWPDVGHLLYIGNLETKREAILAIKGLVSDSGDLIECPSHCECRD